MEAKDFRKVLLYLCNSWTDRESNLIFNNKNDFDNDWLYSLGWHIWNKWITACEEHHGPLDGIAWFLFELDEYNLQKLINHILN